MQSKSQTLNIKVVGKRKGFDTSAKAANDWLRTIKRLRVHDVVCKRGVYKFRTFKEADQWKRKALVESFLAARHSTI